MINTQRLRLQPLKHEDLLLYKNDPEALAKKLELNFDQIQNDPATEIDHQEAIEFWINKTLEFKDHFEWFTNWQIILIGENRAIGGIGFAGLPDEEGKTMVGYGLDVRFNGKGYATEALAALCLWGFSHPVLLSIIADTPEKHIASQRVLSKNGFSQTGCSSGLIHWRKVR